jgi:hypothetical protein
MILFGFYSWFKIALRRNTHHLPAVAPIVSFQVVAMERAQLFKLINH